MKKPEQQTLADEPRGRSYVYPTWVTKLLAGESRCWYSAWYKCHFKYLKKADDQDREDFFAEYNEAHNKIEERRAAALREDGWTVKVEADGEFKIRGEAGDLSGKPDIVAMKGETALVVEAKSGKPRQSDHWQVLLYMVFLPLSWMKGFREVRGEVEYRDGIVDVRPITEAERTKIKEALRRVTGPHAPVAQPSRSECKFCDVARCQYREEPSEGDAGGMF